MKFSLAAILMTLITVSLLAGCGSTQTCPRIGAKAPDFSLTGSDGKNISLSSFSGKPVIINTWSVSCIECKKEMPYFQEIYKKYSPQGLVILSVNTLDSVATARDFMSANGYTFTLLFDQEHVIYKNFCCPKNADPNTFFISADGILKGIKIGGFVNEEEIESIIKTMQ
ncbi:MAG: redoxin domain-containing protein [Dehalococcoidia bacterium]|nr:redoxin domain-containing protein [Dehalococcoidia bacterium]MDD5493495.1 redoxin domain-containing protein [Dehalococcoidia bacterium]